MASLLKLTEEMDQIQRMKGCPQEASFTDVLRDALVTHRHMRAGVQEGFPHNFIAARGVTSVNLVATGCNAN